MPILVKFCAYPLARGLNNSPLGPAGICCVRFGRLYFSMYLATLLGSAILPASKSCHKTKLLPVYGADHTLFPTK